MTERTPAPPGTTDPSFGGVSCTSSHACVAVGTVWNPAENTNGLLAERWSGRQWSPRIMPSPPGVTIPADSLHAVSCTSQSACTAVGYSVNGRPAERALVERWDGSRWTIQRFPIRAHSNLLGVACTSNKTCIAVGQHFHTALIGRWDGNRWTVQRFPGGDETRLSGISCTSSQDCVTVGKRANRTLAGRWDGRQWSVTPTPNVPATDFGDIFAVSCSSSSVCTAVGSVINAISGQAEPLAERWEDGRWSIQQPAVHAHPGHTSRELNGVSCPSRISCTAVGFRYMFEHRPLIELWNRPRTPAVTG